MPKSLPTWDLTSLYQNLDDPKIEQDLAQLSQAALSLQTKYRTKLTPKISPATLRALLKQYAALVAQLRDLTMYAYLLHSTHKNSPRHGAFFQHIATRATHISNQLLFIPTSLSALPAATLRKLIKHPQLKNFRHFLIKQLAFQPHHLPEAQETILNHKALTSALAWGRLYEQQATQRHYPVQLGRSTKQLNISQLLELYRSPQRPLRQRAARARHTAHQTDPDHNSFIYNTLIQDWRTESELRHFSAPADSRHLENEITPESVAALEQAVTSRYGLVHRYYRYKQKLLKLKKLRDYDKYAPLHATPPKYSFAQAQNLILNAFHNFSPDFAAIAQKFFDESWIDAPAHAQKQAGAFCYYGSPQSHPFVLVNYLGKGSDVSTLAHELGHGVHAYLARHQNPLHFDWPITLAEVASVFAEMIVFDALQAKLTHPADRRALYCEKIESIFATVFRQIAIFRFEQRAHTLRHEQGELAQTTLDQLWLEEQQAMFGSSLSLTDFERSYWQNIPHIFRSPFYVYAYAFGELLTLTLFSLYKQNPADFVPKYLDLLAAGGSASPQKLLQPFGLNLEDPAFWQHGLDEIDQLVRQVRKI
jgi:oligoendopeptidase F